MEKVCEFCMVLRPAVYCQADSALLCLSCDSKVHSANALSNRHLRSPLCDSCQAFPASVRCKDHRMYMCRSCDRSLHGSSDPSCQQQHQKRAISSYIGCPSAKDFATLWDLDLNELRDASPSAFIVPSPQEFAEFGNVSSTAFGQYYQQHSRGSSVRSVISCTNSVRAGMPNDGMKNQQSNKISSKGQQQQQQQQQQNQSSLDIVQQILDLRQLQLNEGNCYSPVVRREEKKNMSSSSREALKRADDIVNESPQHSRDLEDEFLKSVTPLEELRSEGFSSPFSSLENLPSLTAGVSLLGDSFWQCRSPLQTGQFMPQNIQDLGLFEDLSCRNDFSNIPDVDMTFQNFEELFRGDQDPMRGLLTSENDLSCSSLNREISFDKSENSHAPAVENASAPSSECMDSVTHVNTEMKDSAMARYRDKKKARLDGETARQAKLKDRIDVRKRVRGRRSGKSGCNSDDKSTKSY